MEEMVPAYPSNTFHYGTGVYALVCLADLCTFQCEGL